MRRKIWLAVGLAPVLTLAGCGGDGSGGVASTPPPVATNTSLAKLSASQSFANDAAAQNAVFALASSTTTSSTASGTTLSISYDASSNTYSVSTSAGSQKFGNANQTSSGNGQAVYKITNGNTIDHLTLQAATFGGTTGPQYVGLGFWQHDTISGGTQTTNFDSFTYGLATSPANVPLSGQATMATYVFGLTTAPGMQPQSFNGTGQFDIDFKSGVFATTTYVTETALVSGSTSEGGSEKLTASGTLSASTGALSGLVDYQGLNAEDTGTLNGRLYGPTGQEIGATFSTSASDGSATSGSIVGYAPTGSTLTPVNLTLTDLVTDQLYYSIGEALTASNGGASYSTSFGLDHEQLTQHVTGGLDVPALYSLPYSQYAATDEIAGAANFTTYQKTTGGQTVTTEVYNPGPANSELALTYTSFAHIFAGSNAATSPFQEYEVFGLSTPNGVLMARTGTAQYSGVVHGAGGNSSTGATYAVSGTSSFSVDFGSQSLMGALALTGANPSGSVNFGAFNFSGAMARGQGITTGLNQASAAVGTISPQFFGPLGEEIGAPFQLNIPAGAAGAGTAIAGVAVAKGG